MTRVDVTKLSPEALENIGAAAGEAAREAAEAVQIEARQMLARYGLEDSVLAERLTVETGNAGATFVVADADSSRFVEFGTRTQPARPFLGSALESLRAALTTQIAGRIADAFDALRPKS